ncbi:Methylmalonic aciduria and homocystinuria type D-like [Homarus americanus]|uniref:Methylmalonic aciduria and homocystinuria type D-like n=1 Tax=Homarus americanus TaxID=6706 RepID=A0A8J5MLG0_HOMAM|nr:Methylmalonic aciduria and homocystinuria type D-like [Homarus americanus]
MAAKLLCSGERVIVVYTRSLQSLCCGIRKFSSQGLNDSNETTSKPDVKEVSGEPLNSWLDIKAGIFGPSDQRLPLPGNIGLCQQLEPCQLPPVIYRNQGNLKIAPDILTKKTNHEHQIQALDQCNPTEVTRVVEKHIQGNIPAMPHPSDILECKAQQCPDLVKKGSNIKDGPLAVVTLSQKTQHDMGSWSEEMELGRGTYRIYICSTLQADGYWADFIDPTSGRPYHGQFTNATLFETDERYRYLGFRIEDLGCCKIISHRLWGTHVFVGALFTNAPVDSDVLEHALGKHQRNQESS